MPMQHLRFTNSQKDRARTTDLVELLRSQGETLKRSGSEWEWRDGTQKVTIRGNLWFHQYERVGGDAIDFVRRYYDKSYTQAVEYLLGTSNGLLQCSPPVLQDTTPFVLPKANDNMRRVFAYLVNRRGIDRDVLYTFVHRKMVYESAPYHNVVFVGYDTDGNPKHAHKRGTGAQSSYKGNAGGSLPEYSFHWTGKSDKLYLFEAPIDTLSFISMQKANALQTVWARENELRAAGSFERASASAACTWQQHSYAAACSVSDKVLFQMLQDTPHIQPVYLCLDNDEAGLAADKRISDKLFTSGIRHQILIPNQKDWNEDLLFVTQEEAQCPGLQR